MSKREIETSSRLLERTPSGRIPAKCCSAARIIRSLGPPAIDARYLWQANNGDIIIVKYRIGNAHTDIQVRVDSTLCLNNGLFRSSPPGMRPGGVGITMYESKP
jgi:hypothetical protein